jgi:hypothetical protein
VNGERRSFALLRPINDVAAQARIRDLIYARDKCFEREAVVDQRELMKEALKHASGKAPSEHVSRAFDDRIERGDFTSVAHDRPGSPSKQYTTPTVIANERRNIEHMRQGQNRCQPLVSGRIAAEAERSEHLNQSQRRVVSETLSNRDRIFGVQGVAGSGKDDHPARDQDRGTTRRISGTRPCAYAVTSHSAQGATADKVIVHAESGQSAALVNERFAYVAGSRMRDGLDVYTDSSEGLATSLARQFDKTTAVHDKDVAPRLGQESGNGRGTEAATGRAEQQGQSTPQSSSGQGLGHGP